MRTPRITIYLSSMDDWRWRLQSRNGEILASGEAYRTRAGAVRGVVAFLRAARTAVIVHGDPK